MLFFGRAEHCSAHEQFVARGARQGPPLQCVGQGLNEGPGRDSPAQYRDGEKT